MKKYKLNLNPKTISFVRKLAKSHCWNLHIGKIKDFECTDSVTTEIGGCAFDDYNGEKYLFINDFIPMKYGHDLVVLHEVGHLLMWGINNSESYANGYAIATAKQLGLKLNKKMVAHLIKYAG